MTKSGITAAFLAVLMIFSTVLPASAAKKKNTYYIDASAGSDENSGLSQSSAWKTLSKVNSVTLEPGDSVLLKRGGEFNDTLKPSANGEKRSPVTISSYGKGKAPVIKSSAAQPCMIISSCRYLTVENIEFTAAEGGLGIFIIAGNGGDIVGLTLRDCVIHDIGAGRTEDVMSAVYVDNDRAGAKVKDLTFSSLKIYNTSWAIHCKGVNCENDPDVFVSADESYNSGYLFENLDISDACCAGMVLASIKDATVRNCRVSDCATLNDGNAYAPLWMRHCDGVTVEFCEICGSTNKTDGMAIDFDGWTVNSTYRYIYSHDNNRFMKNCVFDSKTHNSGNTVEYCVSVNDNVRMNWGAVSLISKSKPSLGRMHDFTFRKNTVINGKPFFWIAVSKPEISDNTISFSGSGGKFIQKLFNIGKGKDAFSYETPDGEKTELMIRRITSRLPGQTA